MHGLMCIFGSNRLLLISDEGDPIQAQFLDGIGNDFA